MYTKYDCTALDYAVTMHTYTSYDGGFRHIYHHWEEDHSVVDGDHNNYKSVKLCERIYTL